MLVVLKGDTESKKKIIIMEDFNTLIHQQIDQLDRKPPPTTKKLICTMNQTDLINIYKDILSHTGITHLLFISAFNLLWAIK